MRPKLLDDDLVETRATLLCLDGQGPVKVRRQPDPKLTSELLGRQRLGNGFPVLLHVLQAIEHQLANTPESALLALVEPTEAGKLDTGANELGVLFGPGDSVRVVVDVGHTNLPFPLDRDGRWR